MKNLVIIGFLIFQTALCNAQLTVDAGADTTYCVQINPIVNMFLGEQATIKNAVEPVTIAWECELDIGISRIFTASDLLSDTTTLSPYFKDYPLDPWYVTFIVHVTDSENNYSKDSLRVRFSNFGYYLVEWFASIVQGDSIQFDGHAFITGGIAPIDIWHTPGHSLSDSTDLAAWAKPDTTTTYYQMAKDSIGCLSLPQFSWRINVLPNAIVDKTKDCSILQQGGYICIADAPQQLKTLNVYSITGKLLFTEETQENHINVGNKIKIAGTYICSLTIDSKYYSLKFIKN